ncbi:class I SAM-dependent methyltransferase [candidate division KSB1 bacterium]|nr:MAG: class I SAM-dependent methyltransferase [candidate division KSB1 bacterium]
MPNDSEWFENWFDEDYLTLYAHRDLSEARRFVNVLWSALELEAGALVADIPCGAGRYSLAFAERGARVVGMDFSPVMLHRAAEACMLGYACPLFVRGDMRHIPLIGRFHLVANIFSSLGYFESENDNFMAFSELARLLAPGGFLIVDVVNPACLREHFIAETQRAVGDAIVSERRELDLENKRVIKHVDINKGSTTRLIRESVRLYEQNELFDFTVACKLHRLEFWGDYSGASLTPQSPRLILVARKN